MREKGFVVAVVLLLTGMVGAFFAWSSSKENVTTFEFVKEVVVEDGVSIEAEHVVPITLEEDGTYIVYADWKENKSGMISGMVLRDEAGEIQFCVTGERVSAESVELELAAGDYHVQYLFFTNDEQLDALIEESGAVEYDETEYTYAVNDVFEVQYEFQIEKVNSLSYQAGVACGVLAGVACGLLLVAVILKFTKTDKRKECVYDERQLQARGDGFKYGFFTMIVYNVIISLISIADIAFPIQQSVIMMFGMLLSILVYAIYCIRKEAYISLNESASRLKLVFGILGIINFLIGISHCIHGTMVIDGVVTFHAINLMCGLFLLTITGVLMCQKKPVESEEE